MHVKATELAAKGDNPKLTADMRKLFGITVGAFVLLAAALATAVVIEEIYADESSNITTRQFKATRRRRSQIAREANVRN